MPPTIRRNFMQALNIQHLKVTIGIRELLNIRDLHVEHGQKIGLIGKNGSGKTTLFQTLLGERDAEVSNFSIHGTMSMLPQIKPTHTHKSGGEISQEYFIQTLNESPSILLAD